MNGEDKVVFSAGNSWIVCRSKSHSGRIYYFNTLTGEAAWNLSDAEIEKAKTRTKCLAKEQSINIDECPEPREPPTEQTKQMAFSGNNQSSPVSAVYNKQIINNQFPKRSYQMPPIIVPMNTIMALPVNTENSGYNPNVWGAPSTHQFFIGPKMPSLVNQGQTAPVNMQYSNQDPASSVHNTTATTSEHFQHFRNNGFHATTQKKFKRWPKNIHHQENNRFRERKNVCGNMKRNWTVNDLRQVLSAKKKERSASFSAENEINDVPNADNSVEYSSDVDLSGYKSDTTEKGNDVKEKKNQKDADCDWLEENILVENRKLKLNVSNLKNMAKPGVDLDCWYIVADKDILLHHLHFLSILCSSDDDCCLMVAQQVLAELREMSSGAGGGGAAGDAARARRAVSFLLQQLDAGYVVIGDGVCKENDTRCDYLLNCCTNLFEQNHHVILLSNDEEFQVYKNSSYIPIFNVKEIKQFLSKAVPDKQSGKVTEKCPQIKTSESQKVERLKPPPLYKIKPVPQCKKLPIKITVANDLLKKPDEELIPCKVNKETQIYGTPTPIVSPPTFEKHIGTPPDANMVVNHLDISNLPMKHTMESGVQTDMQTAVETSVPNENTSILTQSSEGTSRATQQFATIEKWIEAVPGAIPAVNHLNKSNSPVTIETLAKVNTQPANELSIPNERNSICIQVSEEKMSTQENKLNKNGTKKEIRLVRSTSVKTSSSNESAYVEKKQFKWRRRKCNNGKTTNDSNIAPAITSNFDAENSRGVINVRSNDCSKQTTIDQHLLHNKFEESVSSETSSLFVAKNITNDSVVVEETSTSGIISNSSNVDSESESGKKPTSNFNVKQTEPLECAMFKISDKTMEDSLRTMKDEWVSRFLQVMEEVLTQLLRKDEQFLFDVVYKFHGGGPWTIREAADCIKIKFSHNCNIVDAANKLTNIYQRISDYNGSISPNLQPAEYMEMYSFGVYLIESLQSEVRGCEDLQSAAQSLRRLLADIRSPLQPAHDAHRDSFGYAQPSIQSPTTNKKSEKSSSPIKQINKTPEATPEASLGENSKTYNLRSKKKCSPLAESNKKQNVTFIRNLDVQNSFFTSLNLVKRKRPLTPPLHSNVSEVASSSQNIIKGIFDRSLEERSHESTTDVSSNTNNTRFIRKMIIYPDFEKNFKKTVERESLDMDHLDYSVNCDEDGAVVNEDYDYEDCDEENYDAHEPSFEEKEIKHYSDNGCVLSEDIPVLHNNENVYLKFNDENQFCCDSPLNINRNLNLIFSVIIRRVKEAFLDVQKFCTVTYKELSESQIHSARRKYEINENAERAQVFLDNLCRSLNSVFYRETLEPDKNVQALLKDAGINDFNLNENLLICYRNVIGECFEQAKTLKETIGLVVSANKRKSLNRLS